MSDYEVEFLEDEDIEIATLDLAINKHSESNQSTSKKRDSVKRKIRTEVLKSNRYDFESELLDAVFDRPCLYDYTLPIKSRAPAILITLWKEVCEELKGKFDDINIDIDFVKDIYKTLRNNYTRYKSVTQKEQTSGSSFKNVTEPRHCQKLRRLDSVLEKRAHKTNLDATTDKEPTNDFSSQSDDIIAHDNSMEFRPIKRARKSSVRSTCSTTPDFLEPLNKLVDKVGNRPVLNDMEQHFGDQVAIFLRGLDEKKKYQAQLYFITYMNELIQNK